MGEALIEQAVPVLSESEYVHLSPSGNFALYYQTTGDNAVPEEDSNGSGIPDYIERAAAMADSSWRYQVERSEEHTSELQSRGHLVCRLLLAKKNKNNAG